MWVHFWHQNVQDTVVLLEEGNLPNPWFPMCNMLAPWWYLNRMHRRTAKCRKGEKQRQQRLGAEGYNVVTYRTFSSYGFPLELVTSFKYLWRVISVVGENCPAVVKNLEKAQTVWRRLTRILSREGLASRVYRFFLKAVFQLLLLLGKEILVVTPQMGRVLGGL